jgi:hypothetical protein
MKRFLQTLGLLIAGLLVLASGVDSTLGYLSRVPAQNSFTWYSEQGTVLFATTGSQALVQKFPRTLPANAPMQLHPTRG